MSEHPTKTASPTGPELVRWLTGITRPVHGPLLASLGLRVINLSLDLALFGCLAAGVVRVVADDGESIDGLLVALVILSLTKAAAFYGEQFTGHYVAFKALELLRGHAFAELWPKAPAIVAHSRSGDLLAGLTRDVDRIEVVYAHTFAPVLSAYIVGTGAVIAAAVLVGWAPIAIAVGCLGVSLLVVPYAGTRRAMRATADVLAKRRGLAHQINDTIFGIDEVLGYANAATRSETMDDLGAHIGVRSAGPRDLTGLRRGANVALSLVAVTSVVALGTGDVGPVALAALAAATYRVFEGPRGIEDATGYLDHSLAAARRLWEICHAPMRVDDGPRTYAPEAAPEITFTSVDYAYPGSWEIDATQTPYAPALEDIDVTMPAGGHTIIVGRSGSGKSTLVQLLQRYDDPTSGRVTLNGTGVDEYTLDSLRRQVVSVAQTNQLLAGTIADNLRLGAPEASESELWEALDAAGFATQVRAIPDGLDTDIGTSDVALSGGQIQRLCLARALVMQPAVLVLDEFTANLDADLEETVRSGLRRVLQGATIVEVTHRIRATDSADHIVVLDRGRVIAQGDSAELTSERVAELLHDPVATRPG